MVSTHTLKDIRVELFRFPLAQPMQSPFGRLAARHNLLDPGRQDDHPGCDGGRHGA